MNLCYKKNEFMFMKNEFMVIKNKYTFIRVNICYSPLSCATPRSYRSHRIRLSLPVTPRIDPQNYYKLCYSLSVSLLGKRTQTMFKCSLKFPYTSIMLALCVRPSSSILNGGCYEGITHISDLFKSPWSVTLLCDYPQ
jgi:hypothetical protein